MSGGTLHHEKRWNVKFFTLGCRTFRGEIAMPLMVSGKCRFCGWAGETVAILEAGEVFWQCPQCERFPSVWDTQELRGIERPAMIPTITRLG